MQNRRLYLLCHKTNTFWALASTSRAISLVGRGLYSQRQRCENIGHYDQRVKVWLFFTQAQTAITRENRSINKTNHIQHFMTPMVCDKCLRSTKHKTKLITYKLPRVWCIGLLAACSASSMHLKLINEQLLHTKGEHVENQHMLMIKCRTYPNVSFGVYSLSAVQVPHLQFNIRQ